MEGNTAGALAGLSDRAQRFVVAHGVRLGPSPIEEYRERWLAAGIPAEQIDRVVAFEARWGGLALPPSPFYEGGPRVFRADVPTLEPDGRWWFEAGDQRASVPFSFLISPDDEFGILGTTTWAPLHADVQGWIEAVALAYHAQFFAKNIQILRGPEVEEIDLDGWEVVPETRGISDVWWRRGDSLIAIYRGEAEAMRHPGSLQAQIYSA